MATSWGSAGFSSAWIDAPNGVDGVNVADEVQSISELEPPHGIVDGVGADGKDHRIGDGNAARGLIHSDKVFNPGITDNTYWVLSQPESMAVCGAVHETPDDTQSVKFSFLLRFDGDFDSLNPAWENPNGWINGGDPKKGSDRVKLMLDVTQNHLSNTLGFADTEHVDYDAEPIFLLHTMNHLVGFPWRVRMDRSSAPAGYTLGPLGLPASFMRSIAECRLYKATTSSGLVGYHLGLVWWGNSVPSAQNFPDGLGKWSSDSILLAAYDANGAAPTIQKSPFWYVDPTVGGYHVWNTVLVEVTVTLNGTATMRCTTVGGPQDGYTEHLEISGEPLVTDGGVDGSGNPVGITHVDIGCFQASRIAWEELAGFEGVYDDTQKAHVLTWAMDSLGGDDFLSLESEQGTTVFSTNFDEGLSAGALQGQQSCTITAFPRSTRDLLWMENSATQGHEEGTQSGSSLRNLKHDDGYSQEFVNLPADFLVDLDGNIGAGAWNHALNNDVGIESIGNTGASVTMTFLAPATNFEYPNEDVPTSPQEGALSFSYGTPGVTQPDQVLKMRFRTTGFGSYAWPAPEGQSPSKYEYSIFVPAVVLNWNDTTDTYTTKRAKQSEIVLFTDANVETDAGVAQGEGDPPVGVGLRIREKSTGKVVVDFFVEGTPSDDTIHTIVGLGSAPSTEQDEVPSDIVFESVDEGANISFRLWVSGVRFLTAASGTSDFTLTKSVLDAPAFHHGIGVHAAGQAVFIPPSTTVGGVILSNSDRGFRHLCASADKYQQWWLKAIDHSQTDYAKQDIIDADVGVHDFAVSADASTPFAWMNTGRMRTVVFTEAKLQSDAFASYSLVNPNGGSTGTPFPGTPSAGALFDVSADFVCALDRQMNGGAPSTDLVSYRGFAIRSIPDEWVALTPPTSGDAAYGAGPGVDMWVPKGITFVLWGNSSDTGTLIGTAGKRIAAQMFAIDDSGATFTQSGVASLWTPSSEAELPSGDESYWRCRLSEELEPDGDRLYTLKLYPWTGTQFAATPLASLTMPVTAAQFSGSGGGSSGLSGTQVSMHRYFRYGSTPSAAQERISTTVMTRMSVGTLIPTEAQTYETKAAVALDEVPKTISNVRGVMDVGLGKTITGVRGLMTGVIKDTGALPVKRHLLVFEKSLDGFVPGSWSWVQAGYPTSEQEGGKDYFHAGVASQLEPGEIWWGGADQHFDELALNEHKLEPMSLVVQGDGTAEFTLRQDSIAWWGGHLRAGQLVVYAEEVTGAPWEITSEGMIYGGNGIKVLFRGMITNVARDNQVAGVSYLARGPIEQLLETDILELTECAVGQLAFNVEKGSPNTAYAISKNLGFDEALPSDDTADSYGSILGPGTPNLVGMTVAEIIEYIVNNFRYELNERGLLRLNSSGELVVDDGVVPTGYTSADVASIAFLPSKGSFAVIPPEIVVKGGVGQMMRGILAMLPNTRFRVEPGTMRWVFESLEGAQESSLNIDPPGAVLQVEDDASRAHTRVIFSSPWQKQEKFLATFKDGTLKTAWGTAIDGEWSLPFGQIGQFTGTVTSAQNFPFLESQDFTNPDTGQKYGPQSTVINGSMQSEDAEFPVSSFNGATIKITSGALTGKQGTVIIGFVQGGPNAATGTMGLTMTIEPALGGGYGDAVDLEPGDEFIVTDDPTEGTTAETGAWKATWVDYVVLDPDSGQPATNLVNSGPGNFTVFAPANGSLGSSGASSVYNVAGNVTNGTTASAAFPLAAPGTACGIGTATAPTDIYYNAMRILEGTWCAAAPLEGFAGTAYTDIEEYNGVVTQVHSDGKGFVDAFANWPKEKWAPSGGSFATLLLVGGNALVFDSSDYIPGAFPDSDINAGVDEAFVGGWDETPAAASQDQAPLEERSIDASDDVAEWHKAGSGSAWATSTGIRWKDTAGSVGRTRGAILTRFVPGNYDGPQDFTSPDLLYGEAWTGGLNNQRVIDVDLIVDLTHAVTSLSQVGVILRAENGWVEQRRVPPNDRGAATPLFSEDSVDDELEAGLSSVYGLSAEAGFSGAVGTTGQNEKAKGWDVIPDWISSDATKKRFKTASTPTIGGGDPGEAQYNGVEVLGDGGVVLDARYFKGKAGFGDDELEGADFETTVIWQAGIPGWTVNNAPYTGAQDLFTIGGELWIIHDATLNEEMGLHQSVDLVGGTKYRATVTLIPVFTLTGHEYELSVDSGSAIKGGDIAVASASAVNEETGTTLEVEFTAPGTGTSTVTFSIHDKNTTHPQVVTRFFDCQLVEVQPKIEDVTDDYSAGNSTTWPNAKRQLCRGLQHGTTGYVLRFVRGDEPDMRLTPAATPYDYCYPTIFWYHVRRAVDPTTGEQAYDTSGHPVYEGVKEIAWQSPYGINDAVIGQGSNLRFQLQVEMAAPFGKKNLLKWSLTGLVDTTEVLGSGQFFGEFSHDARALLLRQGETFAGGASSGGNGATTSLAGPGGEPLISDFDIFPLTGFDGCYSGWKQGFSMARGAGGFGLGVVKAPMTAPADSGPSAGQWTTVEAAKVKRMRVRRINKPVWEVGGATGLTPADIPALIESQYEQAVPVKITRSGKNWLRFMGNTSELASGGPNPGDGYKIVFERGWKIARTRVFEASGLDDPTKVWIFKHLAEAALDAGKDKAYTGTVRLQGIAYELADAGKLINVVSLDTHTGLEHAKQPTATVTLQLSGDRSTAVSLSADARGQLFSTVQELLQAELQKAAVDVNPWYLGQNQNLSLIKQQQSQNLGFDQTKALGSSTAGIQVCGDQVVTNLFGDSTTNFEQITLNEWLGIFNNWLLKIKVLVDANKDAGDAVQGIRAPGGLGGSGGLFILDGPFGEEVAPDIYNVLTSGRASTLDDQLIFPDSAWKDPITNKLWSPKLVRDPVSGSLSAVWAQVEEDPSKPRRYRKITTVTAFDEYMPREAGNSINSTAIDGTSFFYQVFCDFARPSVEVRALPGYSGPSGPLGGLAIAGQTLDGFNCGGFSILQDSVFHNLISIVASSSFGPCEILFSS